MRDDIFNSKIVSTTVADSRFVEGESLEETMSSNRQFGKSLRIFLDNGTFLNIEPVLDRWGEPLIGCETGHWTSVDNEIVIVP